MAKGFVRKIDELGRIVIPIELRRTVDAMNRDMMDLYLINGIMRLTKGKGRRLDELGRYTIPIEIRRTHGWEIGQEMDIYIEDDMICVKKDGCEWCDETEDLIEVAGHKICTSCANKVTLAYMEASN